MSLQDIYQNTIQFAAQKHTEINQTIPGTNLPYVVHLSNVAMEILVASEQSESFNTGVAVQVALLHDVLEDTGATFEELSEKFGKAVAEGVLSLTKNVELPKDERMADSIKRIRQQPREVWAVKLADRITNLQKPPHFWISEKIEKYRQEATMILKELRGGNTYLEDRLQSKIENYNAD
ncbi:HD domain-containing protein [uncultured Chryseobacterium sp.]|uniref:HD domain-containing protein n=1 Tax=uncultured Chryseobacterium sp. TaxID=259322 RepID=UPI0025FD39C4|nr:HD domain-containing protein [uncultured Chryseobacterium sp.]